MRKYLFLSLLVVLIACGDSNSTKYCADGSLAPCTDGSTPVAQSTAPVNPQVPTGSATAQPGVAQQPPIVYQQAPAQQSSGFSWGDALMGYVVGNMIFGGGSSRQETVRERVIERPTQVEHPSAPVAPITPNKNFNNQSSRNADVKSPAAKPPAAKPSGSAPKSSSSSSFGGSSSRSSGGRR